MIFPDTHNIIVKLAEERLLSLFFKLPIPLHTSPKMKPHTHNKISRARMTVVLVPELRNSPQQESHGKGN